MSRLWGRLTGAVKRVRDGVSVEKTITLRCDVSRAREVCEAAAPPLEVVETWSPAGELWLRDTPRDRFSKALEAKSSMWRRIVKGGYCEMRVRVSAERDHARCDISASRWGLGPALRDFLKDLANEFGHRIETEFGGLHPLAVSEDAASGEAVEQVFVSYRRQDTGYITDEICKQLEGEFGDAAIFKDLEAIPLGSDWAAVLERVLARCEVIVVVIGRDWLMRSADGTRRRLHEEGDWVRREVSAGLRRGIPVIPALVRGAPMPRPEDLPADLVTLPKFNGLEIRRGRDFEPDVARLAADIEDILA